MPGGLMQLIAVGNQDQFLTISPEFSFFKQVYKRHTNFAMESVKQTFLTKPVLDTTGGTYYCRLGRVADMVNQIYLCFSLPDIYSNESYRFQWVKNIGQYMIDEYSVRVDAQTLDMGYGEWMDIWNELSLPVSKKGAYDKMVGNTSDMISPTASTTRTIIQNNRIYYSTYPSATATQPSIKGRSFFLPLPFWFTRNPAAALPLVALQYQIVEVAIKLRSINELYTLYDATEGVHISPLEWKRRYPSDNVNIGRFLSFAGNDKTSIDIEGYLECNYIFLDDAERRQIAGNSMDLLVERLYRSETGGIIKQGTVDLIIANPIKEIIFVTRRSDAYKYNSWGNFTMSVPEDGNASILKTAKILWNGVDRFEEKPAEYFNLLQPYQHHSNIARQGIYPYSFALNPEDWQPSGSFNASTVNKIQLYVTTNDTVNREYTVVVYSVYYNVFRLLGGNAAMVFTS